MEKSSTLSLTKKSKFDFSVFDENFRLVVWNKIKFHLVLKVKFQKKKIIIEKSLIRENKPKDITRVSIPKTSILRNLCVSQGVFGLAQDIVS